MVAAGSGSGSEARRPLRAEWAPSQAWCTARLAQVLRGEQMVGGYVDGRDAALVARGKPEGGGRVDRQGGLQVTRPLEVALDSEGLTGVRTGGGHRVGVAHRRRGSR
jgi:hypothetical protein